MLHSLASNPYLSLLGQQQQQEQQQQHQQHRKHAGYNDYKSKKTAQEKNSKVLDKNEVSSTMEEDEEEFECQSTSKSNHAQALFRKVNNSQLQIINIRKYDMVNIKVEVPFFFSFLMLASVRVHLLLLITQGFNTLIIFKCSPSTVHI